MMDWNHARATYQSRISPFGKCNECKNHGKNILGYPETQFLCPPSRIIYLQIIIAVGSRADGLHSLNFVFMETGQNQLDGKRMC